MYSVSSQNMCWPALTSHGDKCNQMCYLERRAQISESWGKSHGSKYILGWSGYPYDQMLQFEHCYDNGAFPLVTIILTTVVFINPLQNIWRLSNELQLLTQRREGTMPGDMHNCGGHTTISINGHRQFCHVLTKRVIHSKQFLFAPSTSASRRWLKETKFPTIGPLQM